MVSGSGDGPGGIAQIARPIRGEQALDQLLDLVGTARIVLIGEASHGTHEFYDLRASLTRRLITYHGFDAVAIDGDWPDALRVDRYVRWQGDDDLAQDALCAFDRFPQWMWRNTDVAAFVDWLRSWNGQRPPEHRAGFYGLDLYSLNASIRAVLSCLDDADPAAARVARERYACLDHAGGDPEHDGVQPRSVLAESYEDEVVAQLVEMQRRHAARSGRTPSGDGWFHAMQNAHVIKDAEAYYRAMLGDRGASWNLRDTHLADTLDLLAEHLGIFGRPAKLVVWAHNSHVGDARAARGGAGGELTLGQLMRQRHPGEALLIGMTTHTGAVCCAREWDGPWGPARVRPSLPGSWEELFHEAGIPRFYVTAAALGRLLGKDAERLHRAIGIIYRPENERRSHYYPARLAEQYDVVIHVDTTHAVRMFDVTTPVGPLPDDPDATETFPTRA
ncbi:MAG TPA: erythromycin esterase family protein [Kofleriaceae bacterium]|nr:erythromycin esterase family protein [Kofleriaceae bacterium]